jgi:hypothetical protein
MSKCQVSSGRVGFPEQDVIIDRSKRVKYVQSKYALFARPRGYGRGRSEGLRQFQKRSKVPSDEKTGKTVQLSLSLGDEGGPMR